MSRKRRRSTTKSGAPTGASANLPHAIRQPHIFPQPAMPQQPATSVSVVHHHEQWTGPLPSPQQLQQFDEIVPGTAERIIRMAEQEGENSRQLQRDALRETVAAQRRGQYLAAVIALSGMGASVWLALAGHDTVASILGGATLATIVVAFLQSVRGGKSQG